MPPKNPPSSGWDSLKKWVVGLTSVLVVAPALINSGIDVYKAVLNVPRTDAEHANVKFFQKYWNKPPVATLPVPVKHKGATYEAKFSIYEEGDVYIEFGSFTQWFPFPEPEAKKVASAWSPIATAYAQSQDPPRVYGPFRQQDSAQGFLLYRQRVYENGTIENFVIDMRTGAVVNYNVALSPANPQANMNKVAPFAGIDLDRPRQTSQANQSVAQICVTQIGNCAMIQAIPRGVPCFCPTIQGPVSGISN